MMIEYTQKIKPRITDINYGGHLGHMELLGLLHEVRVQFLKKNGQNELEISNSALIMKHVSIDYKSEAFWDNELEVQMMVRLDKAKIQFSYTVLNLEKNNVTAVAETSMVLVDKISLKILKPSPFFERLGS